ASLPAMALADLPAEQPPTIVVHYNDLDIGTEVGAARLRSRVVSAVNSVCSVFDADELAARGRALVCRRDALARVNPQMALAVRAAAARHFAQTASGPDRAAP